jgi:hypothetical protein
MPSPSALLPKESTAATIAQARLVESFDDGVNPEFMRVQQVISAWIRAKNRQAHQRLTSGLASNVSLSQRRVILSLHAGAWRGTPSEARNV